MDVVNWHALEPTAADLASAAQKVQGVVHLRALVQALVGAVLDGYPWKGRKDLVPVFAPSRTYTPSDFVALPQRDEQGLRPDSWAIAQVEAVEQAQNPAQGAFQVVTLRVGSKKRLLAAGIPGARPLPLHFPPEDPEDREWLVAHITDTFWAPLVALVQKAAREGTLGVILQGDQALRRDELVPLADRWQLERRFAGLVSRNALFLTLDDLLADFQSEGWAKGVPRDVARFSLEFHLREAGYRDLGGQRWTSAQVLQAVGRKVARRPPVPAVRSKLAQERGEDDTPDFASYEEVKLEEEARAALAEMGEGAEAEAPRPPQTLDQWRRTAPRGPIRLPPLTYQHIYEAFFPLTRDLALAFPPGDDPLLVQVTVVEGEPLPCLVSRKEKLVKAIDVREFADRFLSRGIPAGTHMWLERLGDYEYRLFPRPLSEPRLVRCKLLSLQEGRLLVEEAEIPMRYEGDPHLFKAELRFEDLEALFQEAKEAGLSIFDAMWHAFPDLARLDPEGKVHWKDLFQAVFFRCRMCSPRSVLTELYTRRCFVPVGEGYFRFEPGRGIARQTKPLVSPTTQRPPRKPRPPGPEPPAPLPVGEERRPATETTGEVPSGPRVEPPGPQALPTGPEPVTPPQEEVPGPAQEEPAAPAAPQPPKPEPPAPPPRPPRPKPAPPRPAAKSLFSEHYLEHRIQEHPEWAEDVAEPLARLQALYREKRDILLACNEAQTEAEFIRPVLEVLGFAYVPQPAARRAGRAQRPDYALFADEKTKEEAYAYALQQEEQAFYARAVAVADAKYWERPLNEVRRDDPRDDFKNTNPSFQIVNYLIGTGVDWGILTNGRHWRLYSRQASSTATEFYEVDLVALLEAGDPEAFKRFWLFFRREAFRKDAQGRNFLERVREGSATYAQTVGDRLKTLVFQEVFPFFAGGFAAYGAARGEDVTSEEARKAIYEATLSFLYKLLFLFYAEARGLLPMDNPGYRSKSLTSLAREIADKVDRREPLGETSTDFYDRLLNLFRLVDQGDRGLGLPRYNGGLFHFAFRNTDEREKHSANWFLAHHKMADRFLAQALDRLYRADGEPVDYGYLDVRHLGAIYEGLLEHRLVVDDAARGEVHLQTDKGERKATGSYYTPDYIVKYIVRHTLGPILEERAARFGELMGRIQEVRQRLADPRQAAGVRALRQELERLQDQAREALLDIKVCDPAMGSGHFLVEAVDFLTDGLVDILNQYPEHNPVLEMLAQVREDIVESLAAQGIAVDPARLDDTQLLQRVVMKRCIYGVDLNPMAVELAKVSLWLHTFTVGAPLSFLDHHLRCGNSLIGAMAREVEREMAAPGSTGQMTFLTGPFTGLLRAAEIMRGITLLSDATYEEVEKSEDLFRGFDEAATPYKQLLDIYVAQHFGVRHAREFLTLYGPDVMKLGPEAVGEPYRTVMREAQRLWREKRFFHWDLEFPEVFIDLKRSAWKENPGFDAVVGNPPYDELSEVALGRKIEEKNFIDAAALYREARTYRVNLYRLFIACAVDKTRRRGNQGFIVPMSLLGDRFTLDLRRKLLTETNFRRIEVFPQKDDPKNRVFPDAKLPTCVYVLTNQSSSEPFTVRTHPGKEILEDSPAFQATGQEIMEFDPENLTIPIVGQADWNLARKMARSQRLRPLGEIAHPMSGEVVFNEAFRPYLSDDPRHTLVLRGGHIQRYEIVDDPKQGTPVYIDIQRWLANASSGTAAFAHKRPRIVYQESAALDNWRRVIATFLPAGNVCGHKICYFTDVKYNSLALLALFNSAVVEWRFRLVSTTNNLAAYQIIAIPIPKFAFTTPAGERARLVEEGKRLVEAFTSPHPRPPAADTPSPLHSVERGEGGGRGEVPYPAFLASPLGRWLEERLTPKHRPDPDLVRQHNADPLNKDWPLPEEGPVEQSDVVHDLLAHLAEQMIEMNKAKQAEVRGFLQYLEREMRAPVDDLTGKARVRNYLGDYQKGEPHLTFDELLDILRRNRRALAVDPSARAFQERLKGEYEASLARLLPLKERLRATDRLIDLIVYRLYGLTKEEVAVVEGHSG